MPTGDTILKYVDCELNNAVHELSNCMTMHLTLYIDTNTLVMENTCVHSHFCFGTENATTDVALREHIQVHLAHVDRELPSR